MSDSDNRPTPISAFPTLDLLQQVTSSVSKLSTDDPSSFSPIFSITPTLSSPFGAGRDGFSTLPKKTTTPPSSKSRATGKKSISTSAQLLHKRLQVSDQVETSDMIMSSNLEDMAIMSNIPQWLIYSWTSKARDKTLTDRKTQRAVAELFVIKQYAFPAALCLTLSSTQQDSAARILLTVFQGINRALGSSSVNHIMPTTSSVNVRTFGLINSSSSSSLDMGYANAALTLSEKQKRDHIVGFLEVMIAAEVEECKTDATLFRSNNVISKLLTLYANTMAKEYLHSILSESVAKLLQNPSLEVDPGKLDPTSPDTSKIAAANMQKLLSATKGLLNTVIESLPRCPVGMRKLCHVIQKQVELKFEKKNRQVAVGGFIFLRLICPAVVSPDAFGLVTQPLTPVQRRNLILVSKVIQNLANGVMFGAKEAFMAPANEFLTQNEAIVDKFCRDLQAVDTNIVYVLTEAEDAVAQKNTEFHAGLVQLMALINTQIEKVTPRLDTIQVNEVMSYTVFGALKCILKRFELMERVYDVTTAAVTDKNVLKSVVRDDEMSKNFVLLGGLEEVLLMNRCVLLRGLLHPSNFHRNKAGSQSTLVNEINGMAKAAIQVLGPHGGLKLCEFVEYIFESQVNIVATEQNIGLDRRHLIFRKVVEGPAVNSIQEAPSRLSSGSCGCITFKLLSDFLLAHVRDYVKPMLTEVVRSIAGDKSVTTSRFEIDPSLLTEKQSLKDNLDNLVSSSMKVFDVVTNSAKLIPESMKHLIKYLCRVQTGPEGADDGMAEFLVASFVLQRLICPAISSPSYYGLLSESGPPSRTFVLLGYMMRFLSARLIQSPDDVRAMDSSDEIAPYEKEILAPTLEKLKIKVTAWIMSILHYSPSTANFNDVYVSYSSASNVQSVQLNHSPSPIESSASIQSSLAESKASKHSSDAPIMMNSTARSKGILLLRKLLTPATISHLKTIIDISEFKPGQQSGNTVGTMSPTQDSQAAKDILSGYRSKIVHYKLLDRVRIVFSSIFKEPESSTLVSEAFTQAVQRKSKFSVELTLPRSASQASGTQRSLRNSLTPASIPEERGRTGGFVMLTNRARKGMPTSGGTVSHSSTMTGDVITARARAGSDVGDEGRRQLAISTTTQATAGGISNPPSPTDDSPSPSASKRNSVSQRASSFSSRSGAGTVSRATGAANKSLFHAILNTVRFGHVDVPQDSDLIGGADDVTDTGFGSMPPEATASGTTIDRGLISVLRANRIAGGTSSPRPESPPGDKKGTAAKRDKLRKKGKLRFTRVGNEDGDVAKNGLGTIGRTKSDSSFAASAPALASSSSKRNGTQDPYGIVNWDEDDSGSDAEKVTKKKTAATPSNPIAALRGSMMTTSDKKLESTSSGSNLFFKMPFKKKDSSADV